MKDVQGQLDHTITQQKKC